MSKIDVYDNSYLQYTVREDGDFLELDFVIDELVLDRIIVTREIALILAKKIYEDFYYQEIIDG